MTYPENHILKLPPKYKEEVNNYSVNKKPFFFCIDYKAISPIVIPLEELKEKGWRIRFPSFNTGENGSFEEETLISYSPLRYERYIKSFNEVKKHIYQGNSYLCNYTCHVNISLSHSLQELFSIVQAKYVICNKGKYLCFSPETFVTIREGVISTYPMKGTEVKKEAGTTLNENDKEVREHYTVVDLLRNDLARVSTNVQVKKLGYVEELQTNKGVLLQMSSEITGEVDEDWQETLGDLLEALLPAGSVTGAPKKRTCEIIEEVEDHRRGYYTGVAGIYDGESLDSCVLIRFIEQQGDNFFYKAGGGITSLSDGDYEYRELHDKIYLPIF